jgi:uncharacterized iron-regulated membrane protein
MKLFTPKNIYRLHVYGGLWLGGHFLLLLITGVILLWKPSETSAEPQGNAPRASYAALAERALGKFSGEHILSLFPDHHDADIVHLRIGKSENFRDVRKIALNRRGGEEVASKPETGFFAYTLKIHSELLLGGVGKILVGASGLVILLILASGFALLPRFRRGMAHDSIRRGSPYLFMADVHKWLSCIAGGWALLITVTGIFLSFNSLLLKIYLSGLLRRLNADFAGQSPPGEGLAPLDKVIKAAESARPGSHLDFLSFPGTEFSVPGHFIALLSHKARGGGEITELAVLQGATGSLMRVENLPAYIKLLQVSGPLHFGNYGGLALKITWAAFSFVLLALITAAFVGRWKRNHPPALRRYPSRITPALAHPWAAPAALGLSSIAGAVIALFGGAAFLVPSAALLLAPFFVAAHSFKIRLAEARVRP